MPKGKRKAKDEEEILAAAVHYEELLKVYRARPDRIGIVEAELSRLYFEYIEKHYRPDAQAYRSGPHPERKE